MEELRKAKKRAGTENVAGIVGFGKAAELACHNLSDHISNCSSLRDYFWQQIEDKISGVQLNGPKDGRRHPGNLNIFLRLYRRGSYPSHA